MLHIRDLCVDSDSGRILERVSLSLQRGETVCVVGPNGAGKTTLLRCATGERAPDAGRVDRERGARIAYLAQDDERSFEGSAEERIWWHEPRLGRLRARLHDDAEALAAFQEGGGWERESRVAGYARSFGIADLLSLPYARLSLGQRRKVDLVGVLVRDAELLVLDEPANHLDLRGIAALEEALLVAKRRGQAALIVSHDRQLVDNLADRTVHVERGGVSVVQGGYSDATAHREREHAARAHRAQTLRRKIQALERDMRRRMDWGLRKERSKRGMGAAKPFIGARAKRMMRRAKAVEKRLEGRVAELERAKPWVAKRVQLDFPRYEVPRRTLARLDGVEVRFGSRRVLEGVSLELDTRDRVALIGENGAGKTTLLRLVAGSAVPDAGSVTRPAEVRTGVVTQGMEGLFEREIFLENFLGTGCEESEVRRFLGAALLRREKVLQPVATLSQGERMRGALVKLLLERAEFLILDEPTTHLDVESVEVLEALLGRFTGGFLLVSHDRLLVERVCERILLLERGRLAPL